MYKSHSSTGHGKWLLHPRAACGPFMDHQSDHLPVHVLRGVQAPHVIPAVPVREVFVTNKVGDAGEQALDLCSRGNTVLPATPQGGRHHHVFYPVKGR